ncbi:MAG: glycosyltransferase family 9 protein [Bacteroidota bacterium]
MLSARKSSSRRVFRIVTWGGLGDALIIMPSLQALKRKYPDCRVIVYCENARQKDIFIGYPFVDKVRGTSWFWNAFAYVHYFLKPSDFIRTEFHLALSGFLRTDKHICHIVAEEIFDVHANEFKPHIYFTAEEEQFGTSFVQNLRKTIAIHVTSTTSKNHMWPIEKWNDLVSAMPDYTFIQLGTASEPQVNGVIDLRGKTTLRQSLNILKHADCFVGIEAFFNHAAHAVDTPAVIIFGDADPAMWNYQGNRVVTKSLECSPCDAILLGGDCPYQQKCMTLIDIAEVKTAILARLADGRSSQEARVA